MTEPEKTIYDVADSVKSTVDAAIEPSLAERVEDARVRSVELASTATKTARDFVHDHPVATLAGGIALGALIAAAFARSLPTKTETASKKAGDDVDVISARISHLASLGADLAMAYAARAASAGKDGASKIEDMVKDHLNQAGEDTDKAATQASNKAGSFADMVINSLRDAGETALAQLNKIKKD